MALLPCLLVCLVKLADQYGRWTHDWAVVRQYIFLLVCLKGALRFLLYNPNKYKHDMTSSNGDVSLCMYPVASFFVILVVRRGILTFMFALLATAPRSLLFPYHFFIEFSHSTHWTTKTSVLFPLLSLLADSRLWYLIPAATRAWAIETISMTWTMLHAKRRIEDIFHSLLKWFSQSLNLHIYFRRNKCAYPPFIRYSRY